MAVTASLTKHLTNQQTLTKADTKLPLVVLVAYYFPPSPAVGGVRPYRWYKYLKRLGFPCRVLTATPGAVQVQVDPDVIVVPDAAARFNSDATADARHSSSFSLAAEIDRIARLLVFPGQVGLSWSLAASRAGRRLVRQHRGNAVVVSTYPPTGAHLAGMLLARSARSPWIADFRDPLLPQPGRFAGALFTRFEKYAFEHAAAVIANVDSAAEAYLAKYPAARPRVHVIWNGFDPEEGVSAGPLPEPDVRTLVHAGSLYAGRNANLLIESIARLRARGAPEARDVAVTLLGDNHGYGASSDTELVERARQDGWLQSLPPVSPAEALQAVATAHGLVLLQPQTSVQVPAKLFQYICIGRPIIAITPHASPVERILEKAGIPYVCVYPNDTPEERDRKVLSYLQLPSVPARPSDWFNQTFDSSAHARRLGEIISSIT